MSAASLRRAERHARLSRTREVGGVLIGFRAGEDVHVEDVVPVDDASSTGTRFRLRSGPREEAIANYLSRRPKGSMLGYVGTWHSHLADVGPSLTDRRTFHRELWSARDVVALVVVARFDGGWHPYALAGRPRLRARTCTVELV
jgi:integrative and conjugative element protein (TIGR02256 family)